MILFINLPCRGHVIPTIGLMQELIKAVMEDTQIRENLQRIQEEIACAPGNAGTVGIIETFSQR